MINKLYTKEEVIEILRLDSKTVKDPMESLKYLIRTGQITPVKVSGVYLFTEDSINNYIEYCKAKS